MEWFLSTNLAHPFTHFLFLSSFNQHSATLRPTQGSLWSSRTLWRVDEPGTEHDKQTICSTDVLIVACWTWKHFTLIAAHQWPETRMLQWSCIRGTYIIRLLIFSIKKSYSENDQNPDKTQNRNINVHSAWSCHSGRSSSNLPWFHFPSLHSSSVASGLPPFFFFLRAFILILMLEYI